MYIYTYIYIYVYTLSSLASQYIRFNWSFSLHHCIKYSVTEHYLQISSRRLKELKWVIGATRLALADPGYEESCSSCPPLFPSSGNSPQSWQNWTSESRYLLWFAMRILLYFSSFSWPSTSHVKLIIWSGWQNFIEEHKQGEERACFKSICLS